MLFLQLQLRFKLPFYRKEQILEARFIEILSTLITNNTAKTN